MKLTFLLSLGVLILASSSPVEALDCAKASSRVDKLICATPELKKADEAMSAAYFKLLHDTADPEFHEALIRSQQRWLKVRSHGPDRFGAAEDDKIDDREVLLGMTDQRLEFLQTPLLVQTMEQEREVTLKDSGGAFAGYKTGCNLRPPPYGHWTYECLGDAYRQHHERVCSAETEWASGHTTEYRRVSILKDGKPKLMATCSIGYDDTTGERCFDPSDYAQKSVTLHWNTNPIPDAQAPVLDTRDLWKYDPDIDPSIVTRQWMHDCLFAPIYPPPEASPSNSAPQK
jgi:uncharacterized protein YecT (DUF1311 family)